MVPVPVFALPLAELRDVGRLARMDEIASKLVPFTPALGSLVFVVHEWASARGASLSRARARDRQPRGRPRSYDAPDPSGAQFELLVSATSAAASADGKGTGTLDQCVADPRGCYLWLDAWSVPRRVGPTRAEGCRRRRAAGSDTSARPRRCRCATQLAACAARATCPSFSPRPTASSCWRRPGGRTRTSRGAR